MAYLGMDDTQMETVAHDLKRAADDLDGVVASSDRLIHELTHAWSGRDSTALVSQWQHQHLPAARQAHDVMAGLAASLMRNISEQRAASGGTGSSGASNKIATHAPTTADYIELAAAGYSDGKIPPGYHPLSEAELKKMGINPNDLHDSVTGLDAKVLRGPDGKVIVTFGGTEGWVRDGAATPDALADAEGAAYMTGQSEKAVMLALMVVAAEGKDNVTFVGHSLGGRDAALASVATGCQAITFNAAGVSTSELTYAMTVRGGQTNVVDYFLGHVDNVTGGFIGGGAIVDERHRVAQGQITNYTSSFDPLTGLQALTRLPDALGRQEVVPDLSLGGDAHDLNSMRRHFKG